MGRKAPRSVTEKKKPSFFQLIHPSSTHEYLRIPPKFTRKHIANDLLQWATLKLEGSSEGPWRVRVRKSGSDMYLKEGWQKFLRDNSLGDKEFLVFIYHGKMRFNIEIFKKHGCKRMDFHNIRAQRNSTVPNSTKRPGGKAMKCSKANPSADKEVREVDVEEDYNDNPAQESAVLYESKVRQFTSTISGRYKVGIPRSFSKEHNSPGMYELSLKNSKRKPLEVKILKSNGGLFFSAGWSAFAKANQIRLHDVCTFELVSEKRMVVQVCRK